MYILRYFKTPKYEHISLGNKYYNAGNLNRRALYGFRATKYIDQCSSVIRTASLEQYRV